MASPQLPLTAVACEICVGYEVAQHGDGPMLACSRCGARVHAVCYGASALAAVAAGEPWQCDYCDLAPFVNCNICSLPGGMMAAAADGGFAHIACALWIPEASYEPLSGVCYGTNMRSNVDRNVLQCVFCGGKGGSTQCASPRCLNAMHASCALGRLRTAGLAAAKALASTAASGRGASRAGKGMPSSDGALADPSALSAPLLPLLPAVIPIVVNGGLELFAFCPKHAVAHGGPRRQYEVIHSALAKAKAEAAAAAAGGAAGVRPPPPCEVDGGAWDPDTTSALAFRQGPGPAPSGDSSAELLRAAQEQSAFLRDIVGPFFGEEADGPASAPLHRLFGALQTHMAPVMSVLASGGGGGGKAPGRHAEAEGAGKARRDLLASLALSSSAIDIMVDGEPAAPIVAPPDGVAWRIAPQPPALAPAPPSEAATSPEREGGQGEGGAGAGTKRPRSDSGSSSSSGSSTSSSSGCAYEWPTGPSTWAFQHEAEALHAHLHVQRHVTNVRLLQLTARVQQQLPLAAAPGAQLLDDDLALALAGRHVGPEVRAGDEAPEAGALAGGLVAVGYRGATQPWQGGVPLSHRGAGPLPTSHPMPVPDAVWDTLAKALTADVRGWGIIVAHFHAGLKDRNFDKAWVPPSWLLAAQGRDAKREAEGGAAAESVHAPAPKGAAAAAPQRPACGVCMDDRETVTDELLACIACTRVVVHKGCYGVPDAKKASFKCDVCRDGSKAPVACALCGNSGGPMKLSRTAEWVHLTCALLCGPSFLPIRTMGPVVLDVEEARAAQARASARYAARAAALCGPPSALVQVYGGTDVWRLLQVARTRADLYKYPTRPCPEAVPESEYGAIYTPLPHPPALPPARLLDKPNAGVCAVCRRGDGRLQACEGAGTAEAEAGEAKGGEAVQVGASGRASSGRVRTATGAGAGCGLFHPLCAWLDGQCVLPATSEEAARDGGTALLGPLGPALACRIHCPAHLPPGSGERDLKQQRVLRGGGGFQLRVTR
jgi:hypothetical protein